MKKRGDCAEAVWWRGQRVKGAGVMWRAGAVSEGLQRHHRGKFGAGGPGWARLGWAGPGPISAADKGRASKVQPGWASTKRAALRPRESKSAEEKRQATREGPRRVFLDALHVPAAPRWVRLSRVRRG